MTGYTDRKVHAPLADKLGTGRPTSAHAVRFSVVGDTGGIAGQRAAHFSIYGDNPAIAKISTFPDEAWDPTNPAAGARYGITWITMADLHHAARGTEPIAAVVCVDDVAFVNITLSSTVQHIHREDGEDLNGVTVLIMSVLNHFPTLREICWADDVTRAGRDKADWTQITSKCKHRDITMVFGGQPYHQRNPGDELALGALGLVGGNDDPTRRRKLTGKRLMKYKLGGAAIGEMQMPHGWNQKKDKHGRPVTEGDRGLVPQADTAMIPVMQALYAAHAEGETYQAIAERMLAFEAEGVLRRRDHTNLDNTYAQAADNPLARYDAAKSFFVRSSFKPKTPPSEQAIARYLSGEDPAEVFDADTRLYIAKVELVRTGRYFRRLTNDIRGRNIVLDGIAATYQDDRDEYGWFDVLSAPWGWPADPTGEQAPRFGVSDQTCRTVAARLLRELRAPKAATGGQAHRTTSRRALQCFDSWPTPPDHPVSRYDDEPTQWGVEARANVSGRANFILLFRRASAGEGARGSRGWSYFGPGETKPNHIAATGSLAELTASVAHKLDAAVHSLADPTAIAPLSAVPADDRDPDPAASWRHRIEAKQSELTQLDAEAKGHRKMAALAAGADDDAEATAYAAQAAEVATRMRAIEVDIARLEAKIQEHQSQQHTSVFRDDQADLSIAAYLVVGLEQASRHNGSAPTRLGTLCDRTFTGWRFHPDGEDLVWRCDAQLPLRLGGHALLPLTGIIRNIRTRSGKALASTETIVRYVFEEGRDLSDVAELLQVTRKTLLTQRVMPWLVTAGMSARGAKCALVDHPLASVRQEVYRWLTRAADGVPSHDDNAYLGRLEVTYLDPDLEWGDAAVPDDITWIVKALRLLTADTDTRKYGLPVLDVALALGHSEADVRELVKPQRRSGGFTRPRYLAYADKAKTRVKAIGCPHGRCQGRRFADHVVLLPEVAASGYGVICTHCRRTPATHDAWPLTQFPRAYLTVWTRSSRSSLRQQGQTVEPSRD